jgi:hypothetical protein
MVLRSSRTYRLILYERTVHAREKAGDDDRKRRHKHGSTCSGTKQVAFVRVSTLSRAVIVYPGLYL